VLLVRGPSDWLPEVASVPDQPPEAVQVAAFVEVHESVACPPLATTLGAAVSAAVGAGWGEEVLEEPAEDAEDPEWQPAMDSARHAVKSQRGRRLIMVGGTVFSKPERGRILALRNAADCRTKPSSLMVPRRCHLTEPNGLTATEAWQSASPAGFEPALPP
jgi:hypothetical protein